ncbi:MAG: hypothetical protein M1816_005041 [Peltula sp. TS41687]|nr:MAG: hypothetical protein M1816_005041 [Peltula sp. TS41687]
MDAPYPGPSTSTTTTWFPHPHLHSSTPSSPSTTVDGQATGYSSDDNMATNHPDSPSNLMVNLKILRHRADQEFIARLDQEFRERKRLHESALAAAAAKHDKVRQNAELVSKRIERETRELHERAEAAAWQAEKERREREIAFEADRRRQLEAEREKVERAERELAARKLEIAEAERKRIELEAVAQAAAESQREAEKEKQKAEEARKRATEGETRNRTSPRAIPESASQPDGLAPVTGAADATTAAGARQTNTPDALHQRYLDLHKRLKEFRKPFLNYAKQNPELKTKTAHTRREIRTRIGQLVEGRGANKIPLNKIATVLREARHDTLSPPVDISPYLLMNPAPGTLTTLNPMLPSLFIYAMNIFSKAIISQFINEAAVSPKSADPIGIVAMQVFASKDFQWGGDSGETQRPLIDFLIAKFHVHCPVLFGVYGPEQTDAGKRLLGWAREDGRDGPWVSEQRHSERMTGLGAGYAAIGLRNFSKSQLNNPYPNRLFWYSFHWMVNVPGDKVTRTHFTVLKAMLENYEKRFIELYGQAAIAAMRVALVDFPNRAVQKSAAAAAVAVLPDVLKRDKRLTL